MGVEIHVRQSHPRGDKGFVKVQQEIHNLMNKQAKTFQQEVSDEIKRSVGTLSGPWEAARKFESNGRLARVTNMEQNRDSSALTWDVGRRSFLDHSIAKYWRTFEYGSLAAGWSFKGKPLMLRPGGFEANSRGKMTPFRSFRPGAKTTGNAGFRWEGSGKDRLLVQSRVTVKHEIQGHHVYRRVWLEQNWEQKVKSEFAEVLRRNL